MSKKFFLDKDKCHLDSVILYNNANNYLRLMNGEFADVDKSHLVTGDMLLQAQTQSSFKTIEMGSNIPIYCKTLKDTLIKIDKVHPTSYKLSWATTNHTIKSNGSTAIVLYPKKNFVNNQWYMVRILAAPAQTDQHLHEGYNWYCGVFCYNSKQKNRVPCFMYQNSYSNDDRGFIIWVQAYDSNQNPIFNTEWEAAGITNIGFYVQRSPAYREPSLNADDLEEDADINACPVWYIRINSLPINCNIYGVE